MIFVSGVTTCPFCGRVMYEIDDLIALQPWPGTSALPGFQSVVAHYDDFLRSPIRNGYLDAAAKAQAAQLARASDAYQSRISLDSDFGLIWLPFAKELRLHYVRWSRQATFRSLAAWRSFLGALLGIDPGPPLPPEPVAVIEHGVNVVIHHFREVPVILTLPQALALRLAQLLELDGGAPDRVLDFGAAAARVGARAECGQCAVRAAARQTGTARNTVRRQGRVHGGGESRESRRADGQPVRAAQALLQQCGRARARAGVVMGGIVCCLARGCLQRELPDDGVILTREA